MRLRSLFWALALAGGFIYLTSKADWSLRRVFQPIQKTGRQWSELEVARTAAFGAELSRVLMQLELKRLVRRLPGNFYERR